MFQNHKIQFYDFSKLVNSKIDDNKVAVRQMRPFYFVLQNLELKKWSPGSGLSVQM